MMARAGWLRGSLAGLVVAGLSAGVLWPLGACGEKEEDKKEEVKKLKFLYAPKVKSTANAVFAPGWTGAQAKAMELSDGENYEVSVVEVAGDTEADQPAAFQAAIQAGGIDGIAVSVSGPLAGTTHIKDAAAAGIPVVTFDSDQADSNRVTYYSFDNAAGGRLAAQLLAKMLNGATTEVAILTWDSTSTNIIARTDGFRTELANHSNLTLPEDHIVKCQTSDIPGCADLLHNFVQTHGSTIGGFFFAAVWMRIFTDAMTAPATPGPGFGTHGVNGTSVPAWREWANASGHYTVAFDSLSKTLEFVQQGKVHALLGQKYWGWGYDTVGLLFDRTTKNTALNAITDSGLDVICPNNVAAYSQAWTSNNFSASLTQCQYLQ